MAGSQSQKKDRVVITGTDLTVEVVSRIALGQATVELSASALQNVARCRDYVARLMREGRKVYGVTTGFGSLASRSVQPELATELQKNLVRSHSTGVGDPLPQAIVRAAMVLRLNTLARGHSGISVDALLLLNECLNRGITPFVPEHGSLGASGDLAPLSHVALTLLGEGTVHFQGSWSSTSEVFSREGLLPVSLGPKEGLALVNGTQMTSALGCLGVVSADNLIRAFENAGALTIEALGAGAEAFDKRIQLLRPIPGQVESAEYMRSLLRGSNSTGAMLRVQEPYSIRCIPQVHGAAREALRFAEEILTIDINSVSDNPLLFPDENMALSGGNFHAQAVAMALDTLAIALVPIANLSERRVERILNPVYSGLPAFLATEGGLNSGYMVTQYTAASLLAESRILSHPASVDTASVSAGQEDHASMGMASGKKLLRVERNLWYVAAIESMCAARAAELANRVSGLGPASRAMYERVRSVVPQTDKDIVLGPLIEELARVIAGPSVGWWL